jgi:hypothetical protein
MQPELFAQMLAIAEENGGQFTVAGQAQHFHNRYNDSRTTNPNFYFVPPSPLIVIGCVRRHFFDVNLENTKRFTFLL